MPDYSICPGPRPRPQPEVTPPSPVSASPIHPRSRSSSPNADERAGRRALLREPSVSSSRLGTLSASSASVAAAAYLGRESRDDGDDDDDEMHAGFTLDATLATSSPRLPSVHSKAIDKDDMDSSRSDEGIDVNWSYRAVDFIALLPPELGIYIMQSLPSHDDVLSCTLVNRLWRSRAMDQSVWRHLFERQAHRGWQLRDDAELMWGRLKEVQRIESRLQREARSKRRATMAAEGADDEDMDLVGDIDGLSGEGSDIAASRRGSETLSDASHASDSGPRHPFDADNTFEVSYDDHDGGDDGDVDTDMDFDDSRLTDMLPQAPRSSLPGWPALYASRYVLSQRWSLEAQRPAAPPRQPSLLAALGRLPSNGFFPQGGAPTTLSVTSAGSPPPTPLDMPGYMSPPLTSTPATAGNIAGIAPSIARPRKRFAPTLRQLSGHGDSVYCVRFDAARWAPPLVGLPNLEAVDLAWRIEKEHGDYVGWVEDRGSSHSSSSIGGGGETSSGGSISSGESGRTSPEERKARRERQALLEEAWQKVKDGLGVRGRIVSGSRDRTIKVWDAQTSTCVYTLKGHKGSVLCLEYDETILVSGSSDKSVLVWDFRMGRHGGGGSGDEGTRDAPQDEAKGAQALGVGIFPDVEEAMAPTSTVSVSSAAVYEGAPRAIGRLRGHVAGVLDVSLSREWILTCGKDATVRVWSRKDLSCHRVYKGHLGPVNAGRLCEASREGGAAKAVSACGHGGIQLWDIETGETLRSFRGHDRGLACIAFRSGIVVSGSNDQTVRIWDEASGRCLGVCVGHSSLVRAVALDMERRIVISAGYDTKVMVWDISAVVDAARRGTTVVSVDEAATTTTSSSATSTSGSDAGVVRLRPSLELTGHTARVFDVQLDGTRVISSSEDLRIAVRDFAHDRPVMRLFA